MRLAGRVALVTGSSRGIGAAIARRLAADGARVVVHARADRDRAEAVAAAIRADGGSADVLLGDLEDAEVPGRLVRDACAIHGTLDILVCNAGGGGAGLVETLDAATIDRTLALNVRATILMVGEYARATQSPHGRVVFLSSGMGANAAYGLSLASAGKSGAEGFVRSVAQELGARGITVNTVAPGTTATERVEGQAWTAKIPPWTALRRLGTPEDIADVVAFLASDEARWLTGLTIAANGGMATTAGNIMARG